MSPRKFVLDLFAEWRRCSTLANTVKLLNPGRGEIGNFSRLWCCAQRPGPMEPRALTRAQCYGNCRAGGTACLMRCSVIPYLPLRLTYAGACGVAVLGCRARCRRITPGGGTASSLLDGNP